MHGNLNKGRFRLTFSGHESLFLLEDIVSVEFPGITLTSTEIPTRGGYVMHRSEGNPIDFDDLTIEFIVDSTMDNYFWFAQWMFDHSDPQTSIAKNVTRQAKLEILDDNNHIRRSVQFHNVRPSRLEAIRFETVSDDTTYEISNLTLIYDYYTLI